MLNRIYTIGHSTRTLLEFVRLLREHDVARLADIRRHPGSRRHPHFSGESLADSLPRRAHILYQHFPDLGGRRNPLKNSPNGAWENPQVRGYADYMASEAFHAAIDLLLDPPPTGNRQPPTAIMCAEAVPWRCHRNLTSDELVRRGIEVIHILGPGSAQKHELNKMARLETDRVIYPPDQAQMF
ncbi:MAG TPA: DUF488 domain-containing protein [Thermoanaerobaculia bacterium]|nr:DUF488 domain-containing protein [Thermoanaerobaculia bacterium]